MKQSIGLTYTLNFIILFIVITFSFLFGIMSYYKAFKVNSRIANAIENNEGYNSLSNAEINSILESLGYSKGSANCSTRKGINPIASTSGDAISNYSICLYEQTKTDDNYFRYGIVTYISIDLPLAGELKLPVYTETEKIYKFNA